MRFSVGAAEGCDLLIWRSKKPPEQAVKSTLAMLLIDDIMRRNEAGAIRSGHLPHRIGAA
jgi:hypothetical protein